MKGVNTTERNIIGTEDIPTFLLITLHIALAPSTILMISFNVVLAPTTILHSLYVTAHHLVRVGYSGNVSTTDINTASTGVPFMEVSL